MTPEIASDWANRMDANARPRARHAVTRRTLVIPPPSAKREKLVESFSVCCIKSRRSLMPGRHTRWDRVARVHRLRHSGILLLLLSLLAAACASSPQAFHPATLGEAPLLFATIDGHRVAYRAAGRGGPALVFVHGWACDMTSWKYQVPAFAKTHRVIAIDLPGHGLSDKPDIAYSMDLFARAVDAVLAADGVRRAVLVGHSMGTMVVRQFYRLHKD